MPSLPQANRYVGPEVKEKVSSKGLLLPSNIKPYYLDESSGIAIYNCDCRLILPSLPKVDLVIISDPPYGISHPTDYKSRGRSVLAECRDYPPVHGDNKSFDPAPFLPYPCVLFGGNYFADKLPVSSGWIVWDKLRPELLDQATAELAWTNCVKGVRVFRYLWHGMIRASDETLFHPTQKPLALMKWIISLPWITPGTIVDPYMGAGSTLLAAKQLGRRAIGVEIEEKYCAIAVERLRQSVFSFEAQDPAPEQMSLEATDGE
jgi:site-specific DNA-methyltransferase (adenine-specific)